MSNIWSRAELLELIRSWKAAYKAVSNGKSYTIDGRSLTYQDVSTIRGQLDWLNGELEAMDSRSGSLRSMKLRSVR